MGPQCNISPSTTSVEVLQAIWTKFELLNPSRSRVRSKKPAKSPFLAQKPLFYGYFERLKSDSMCNGYSWHLIHTRKGVRSSLDQVSTHNEP